MWPPLKISHILQGGMAIYPPGAVFGPRLLTDYEFVWIIEGNVRARFDHYEFQAPPGAILLSRPGMKDIYEWDPKIRSVHAYFHFDFEAPPHPWPSPTQWPMARQMPDDDLLRPLFRFILAQQSLTDPQRTNLLAPSIDLMARSFVAGKLNLATEPYFHLPLAVEKALEYLRQATFQEISQAPDLRQLAKSAHVTPEHLCRLFRKTLNLGPLECARLMRLERASTLLARSNLAIKEVADTTGFANPYHFSRAFREAYHQSPRAYRQAVQTGGILRINPLTRSIGKSFFSKF